MGQRTRGRGLTGQLYRAARISNDLGALASGNPQRIARRARNMIVGRALGRAGIWRRLWGPWTILLTLTMLLGLCASASASYYLPKPGQSCKAGYVGKSVRVLKRHPVIRNGRVEWWVVRHNGKVVWVSQRRCYAVKPVVAVSPPVSAPVSTPTVPVSTPTPPTVRAAIDPAFTQDPANNLKVTWSYDAGNPNGTLPDGTLSLTVFSHGQVGAAGGCEINVGSATQGGTCMVTLPAYGDYDVTVAYSGAQGVSATSNTDTETIEPLPLTIQGMWGNAPLALPTISADVSGDVTSAQVTVSDPDLHGAPNVTLTDQLGDHCTATVAGTHAACSMPLTGVPSAFQIHYPGGTSQSSTRAVAPGGIQQVTTTWPADVVQVSAPTIIREPPPPSAPTRFLSWSATGQAGGSTIPAGINIIVGQSVTLDAYANGSLASDPFPQGYITYTINAPPGGAYTDVNQRAFFTDVGNTPDCSKSLNATGQAVGSCRITFSQPGQYTVRPSFTDTGGVYGNTVGPVEVVNVS